MRVMRQSLLMLTVFVTLGSGFAVAHETRACSNCDPGESRVKAIAKEFAADIHAQNGMSCNACHAAEGGSAQADRISPIARERIPELCGSCHADADRIKKFNPSLHTDQWAQYRTSAHGIKFANGDLKVALCTDCHGVHSIRPASDPRSPVHPLKVAATCQRCHSDAEYMKPYHLATDQYAGYSDSVHHEAMVERGDLSAPSCTTCHGSHGSVPPGVASVAAICGTCHVLQAKYFDESPHRPIFAMMSIASCVTCHGSHRIKHPDDSFVGTGAKAVCGNCHTADEPAGQTANGVHDRFQRLEEGMAGARSLLDRAEHAGMDVGQAQLELNQAGDALVKARVTLHTATFSRVTEEVNVGAGIVAKAQRAGEAALRERQRRRTFVLIPLIAIGALLVSLGAYIREIERGRPPSTGAKR
jgi:cytochrome c3-like protein/doubled CXXCH motif protein